MEDNKIWLEEGRAFVQRRADLIILLGRGTPATASIALKHSRTSGKWLTPGMRCRRVSWWRNSCCSDGRGEAAVDRVRAAGYLKDDYCQCANCEHCHFYEFVSHDNVRPFAHFDGYREIAQSTGTDGVCIFSTNRFALGVGFGSKYKQTTGSA